MDCTISPVIPSEVEGSVRFDAVSSHSAAQHFHIANQKSDVFDRFREISEQILWLLNGFDNYLTKRLELDILVSNRRSLAIYPQEA